MQFSIIICSRTKEVSTAFLENIKETVGGYEYEFIIIDNSKNEISIFQAYNLGIDRSIGEFLCFIHDDIVIHTQDWGKIIQDIFIENPIIGLIGVAGSEIKSKSPSAWWDCPEEFKAINIIQHFNEPARSKEHWNIGFKESAQREVAVIDGVFMVLRRDNRIRFDELLNGFHNYDLNISFEYLIHGYKILVINKILIEHYSIGNINKGWYESTIRLHKKYNRYLPLLASGEMSKEVRKNLEYKNCTNFINGLLRFQLKRQAFFFWIKFLLINPNNKFHFRFIKAFLKK